MRLGTTTTAPPADVFKAAREHFAKRSGLRLTAQTLEVVEFASSIGTVRVEARRSQQGRTSVVVEAREHDPEAKAFVLSLPQQGLIDRLRARIRASRTPGARP